MSLAIDKAFNILEKILGEIPEEVFSVRTQMNKCTIEVPMSVSLTPIIDQGYEFEVKDKTIEISFTV